MLIGVSGRPIRASARSTNSTDVVSGDQRNEIGVAHSTEAANATPATFSFFIVSSPTSPETRIVSSSPHPKQWRPALSGGRSTMDGRALRGGFRFRASIARALPEPLPAACATARAGSRDSANAAGFCAQLRGGTAVGYPDCSFSTLDACRAPLRHRGAHCYKLH